MATGCAVPTSEGLCGNTNDIRQSRAFGQPLCSTHRRQLKVYGAFQVCNRCGLHIKAGSSRKRWCKPCAAVGCEQVLFDGSVCGRSLYDDAGHPRGTVRNGVSLCRTHAEHEKRCNRCGGVLAWDLLGSPRSGRNNRSGRHCSVDCRWSDLIDELRPLVEVTASGCWEFQGPLNSKGYGRWFVSMPEIGLREQVAHRALFVLFGHATPDQIAGLDCDHICENPPCVNPDHLQVLTKSQHHKETWGRYDEQQRSERLAKTFLGNTDLIAGTYEHNGWTMRLKRS